MEALGATFNKSLAELYIANCAWTTVKFLITEPDDCKKRFETLAPEYRRECIHDTAQNAVRELLVDRDFQPEADEDLPFIWDFIRQLLTIIDKTPYQTQKLSELALEFSLCPIHFEDYMLCFEDEDPECESVRKAFPNHDT